MGKGMEKVKTIVIGIKLYFIHKPLFVFIILAISDFFYFSYNMWVS